MSSTISNSVASYSSAYNVVNQNRRKPDTDQFASDLFAKLDTKNQGYIDKSDLESAFSAIGSSSDSAAGNAADTAESSTSTADALFDQLDTDQDGKVTASELANVLSQLNAQADSSRGPLGGNMPPPPDGGEAGLPPGPPPADANGNDLGFTQDELSALASDSATDANAASLFSTLASNFSAADTNGDGRITHDEAMAYQQSQTTSTSASSDATSASATGTDASAALSDAQLMAQLFKLAQSYGIFGDDGSTNTTLSSLISTSV